MQLPIGISLAGLERDDRAPWTRGPRAAIEWAAAAGFRWVQLDAAAAGIRARDLDRSGRRDLAALLRRVHLHLSGLDLWIPAEHFVDRARSERAVEAVAAAIDLAGDLSRLVEGAAATVSVALPEVVPEEVAHVISAQAENRGVMVADHTIRRSGDGPGVVGDPLALMGVGVDPAAELLAGRDPAAAVLAAGKRLKSARLSDASGVGRVAIGAGGVGRSGGSEGNGGGRLDDLAYEAALAAAGYERAVVLDLRGVGHQQAAAERLASDRLRLGGLGGG